MTGNSLIRNFVACEIEDQYSTSREHASARTPSGQSVIVVFAPVHFGLEGGTAANVSPATLQLIGHAVTVMLNGGFAWSYTGDGSAATVRGTNFSVAGSMANCHAPDASNSRSTARGSAALRASTFCVRGMSKA